MIYIHRTLIKDRVISPFCENITLAKISEFTVNLEFEPEQEILVSIAYAQKPPVNANAGLISRVSCLNKN